MPLLFNCYFLRKNNTGKNVSDAGKISSRLECGRPEVLFVYVLVTNTIL